MKLRLLDKCGCEISDLNKPQVVTIPTGQGSRTVVCTVDAIQSNGNWYVSVLSTGEKLTINPKNNLRDYVEEYDYLEFGGTDATIIYIGDRIEVAIPLDDRGGWNYVVGTFEKKCAEGFIIKIGTRCYSVCYRDVSRIVNLTQREFLLAEKEEENELI